MNNYLIASVLDGSFKMRSQEEIRASLTQRVRDLGKNESLTHSDRYSDERGDEIKLPAHLLFDLKDTAYAEALNEHNERHAAWQAEMDALDASINAMRIKVQIGSDKALDVLVEQADKLCSMSLTDASRLFLKDK